MAAQVQGSDAELKQQVEQARRLAEELEAANVRLRALMAEAESARQAAEAANRAKSDFLATVTHEIRTPINAIIGYTDLLLLGVPSEPSPQQVQQLERVRESGNRLIRLIEDVLDLAKIEAGRLDVNASIGVVEEAIHSAMRMTEPLSIAKRIEVVTTADPYGRTAYFGDPSRVEQIVANLLGNAVKFTPTGGRVEVTCDGGRGGNGAAGGGESPVVRVVVKDNGPGIPYEKQEMIFDRFVQGETGYRRSYEGAGLGLAISRELARLMGGDITVESQEGAGAAFMLLLPAAHRGNGPNRAPSPGPQGFTA
jgi:signal transduction histidine kinase